jgi:hypothetical protein
MSCISVFSLELGTYAQPNYVEDILGGVAKVGQPVGLKQASSSDSSEDILPNGGTVSDFYAARMVSAEANQHYGSLKAVQQEYAPFGIPNGLCVGLASVAYQNEELTLRPCSVPGTTVWVVDPALSPTTPGYFPIINASTTDFSRPFAMDLPQNEIASGPADPADARPPPAVPHRRQDATGPAALGRSFRAPEVTRPSSSPQ